MSVPQTDATTDPHSIVAALQQRLDTALSEKATLAEQLAARTAELLERKSEFDERIDHQAATLDVLKAMSASPGDPQPVFDLIVRHATELCNVPAASLFEYDGELVHIRSAYRLETVVPASSLAVANEQFPMRATRGSISCRAILDRQIVHIRDLEADPELAGFVRELGHRAQMSVPLIRDGLAIGVISIGAQQPGGFSDSQVELLKTFAEQAVIAITSAEAYRGLHEALEQQTATAEVLQVINASPGDLAPVFDAMLEKALALCGSAFGTLNVFDGEMFHVVASRGLPAELANYLQKPITPTPGMTLHRVVLGEDIVHVADLMDDDAYRLRRPARVALVDLGGARTQLIVSLRKDNRLIGLIMVYRREVRRYADKHIALLTAFAAQAVIAMENARLITEQREALEQQTAMAEILRVINESPGDLIPVFDAILDRAHRLCGVTHGALVLRDGDTFRAVATHSYSGTFGEQLRKGYRGADNPITRSLIAGARFVHFPDLAQIDHPMVRASVELAGVRTGLYVPLRKDDVLLGMISSARGEIRPFSDKEIALLENFAAQAVIAMENARLITEQREALEQQTATAEVLQVINASPGNLAPVFDTMLERALHLCESAFGVLATYDGEVFHHVAFRGVTPEFAEFLRKPLRSGPGLTLHKVLQGENVVQVADIVDDDAYRSGIPDRRALADLGGARTQLLVALRKDGVLLGVLLIFRQEVRPFTDKQIALLENFAAQAVIAMENARLLNEIRQRQDELRVTFENMGDGVAMFDETPRLVAWNRKFQDILDLPDGVLAERLTFAEYIRYLTERGEFGADTDTETQLRRFHQHMREHYAFERTRPDGRVIDVRHNPVPDGGFVLIYADITERKRSEEEIRAARDAAKSAYRDLKAAQANLIQAEKMASLGQLTAGIAHEIKNPLNFVNNFAILSVDLLAEQKETIAKALASLDDDQRADVEEAVGMLTSNLEKITEHGQRADGIVKAMLEHSRGSSAERRTVNLNALIDEALNLAYHGARAQDQSFNITLERDFGDGIAPIEVNPQDITRVFLNIFSNGFYAATRRARSGGDAGFVPMLKVTTRDAGEVVEIRVRDNGTGIPVEIRDKLFQPFFTTKPTGEGTGLGLSITYDIVTKQHGGTITLDSEVNEFTEFVITLPRLMFTNGGSRA